MSLYPELRAYIGNCLDRQNTILPKRKTALVQLAEHISRRRKSGKIADLNFICTHNSRRSQFGQIWATTAAAYFGVHNVKVFSGGTEATSFNPNAVSALERAGFRVDDPEGENPHYSVRFSDVADVIECFSKKFDDPFNLQKGFAAIMTCSNADEDCPVVTGAEFRIPIMYEDPKVADGTIHEAAIYDERCKQIATEMLYLFSKV